MAHEYAQVVFSESRVPSPESRIFSPKSRLISPESCPSKAQLWRWRMSMRKSSFPSPESRAPSPGSSAPSPVFSWPIRIYWEDTDAGGVVYYANYLRFLERARTEWLRSLGVDQSRVRDAHGVVFVVREVAVEYLAPARLDELITIAARISRFGRTNFTVHCGVFRGNERLTDIEISYTHIDSDSGQPTALPGSFIAEVRRFESRTPAQD